MSYKLTYHQDKGVFIRLTINRVSKYIKLPVEIDKQHWSEETARARTSFKQHRLFNQYIDDILDKVEENMIHIAFEQMNCETAKEFLCDKLFNTRKQNTLRSFANVMIEEFNSRNQPKNGKWIDTAIIQLLNQLDVSDIQLSQLSYNHLHTFKNKLMNRTVEVQGKKVAKPCKPNTINNYLRAIRNVYNTAVKRGVFIQKGKSPFEHDDLIPTITKSPTRNISPEEITALENHTYTSRARQQAVDYWLLGYYLQGADYIDIANLKRSNIHDGYIRFNRAKTNQPVCVKIIPKIQKILSKYSGSISGYLLPIINKPILDKKELAAYEQKRKRQNTYCKAAADEAGVKADLTTKWLRHSWITIAKRMYIEEPIRMQAVGHRSLKGSHSHYADDFEQHIVDAANALVLGYIDYHQYIDTIHYQKPKLLSLHN